MNNIALSEAPLKIVEGVAMVAAREVMFSLFRNGVQLSQGEEDDFLLGCKNYIAAGIRRSEWFKGIQPKSA